MIDCNNIQNQQNSQQSQINNNYNQSNDKKYYEYLKNQGLLSYDENNHSYSLRELKINFSKEPPKPLPDNVMHMNNNIHKRDIISELFMVNIENDSISLNQSISNVYHRSLYAHYIKLYITIEIIVAKRLPSTVNDEDDSGINDDDGWEIIDNDTISNIDDNVLNIIFDLIFKDADKEHYMEAYITQHCNSINQKITQLMEKNITIIQRAQGFITENQHTIDDCDTQINKILQIQKELEPEKTMSKDDKLIKRTDQAIEGNKNSLGKWNKLKGYITQANSYAQFQRFTEDFKEKTKNLDNVIDDNFIENYQQYVKIETQVMQIKSQQPLYIINNQQKTITLRDFLCDIHEIEKQFELEKNNIQNNLWSIYEKIELALQNEQKLKKSELKNFILTAFL